MLSFDQIIKDVIGIFLNRVADIELVTVFKDLIRQRNLLKILLLLEKYLL